MTYQTIDRRRVRALRCGLWAAYVAGGVAVLAALGVAGASGLTVAAAVSALAAGLLIAHRWMRDEGGVPVLMYHSINDDPNWLPWPSTIISVETFKRHLDVLSRSGFSIIQTRDLLDARQKGAPLPPRPVAVHFDDGYLDTWTAALPLLERHRIPATVFVSLDFIEDGATPRPTLADVEAGRATPSDLSWYGYLNWAEIDAMTQGSVMDVQPHGVDHGRVETGPEIAEHLSPQNWQRLAWVQWRGIAGSKADWVHWEAPAAVPLGAPVRVNAPALAGPAWLDSGTRESIGAYEARVRRHLAQAKETLEARCGRTMEVFCWPENGTSPAARQIAGTLGYRATTAGNGENRAGEDPRIISRLGVGDRTIGWRCPKAEGLTLYASIRVFHGNYYWFYLLIAAAVARRVHALIRRRTRTAS
jgi:hypothetical protein